jgi:hypothetical protein
MRFPKFPFYRAGRCHQSLFESGAHISAVGLFQSFTNILYRLTIRNQPLPIKKNLLYFGAQSLFQFAAVLQT